jgi:hypothetical protein
VILQCDGLYNDHRNEKHVLNVHKTPDF